MADPNKEAGLNPGDVVKFAKLIHNTVGRNSITRMAEASISQWPMIVSGDIPIESIMTLVKGYEALYASLLMSVISMNSEYNRDVYSSPAAYLTKFYQNKNIPNIIIGGIESAMEETGVIPEETINRLNEAVEPFVVESATIVRNYDGLVSKDRILELWDCPVDRFNADSLNSIYRPSNKTQKAMEAFINKIKGPAAFTPAMEKTNGPKTGWDWLKSGTHNDPDYAGSPKGASSTTTTKEDVFLDEDGNIRRMNKTITEKKESKARETGKQELVRANNTVSSLEPTLINVQLISHDKGGQIITHNVVVGVKTMVRVISSDLIVSNLVSGVNNSHGAIFKFIQWSNGTKRFVRDFIFGVSQAKENARVDKDARNWINALKRRKGLSRTISKIFGGDIMPNTTVGVTSYEIAKIQQITGIDLMEAYNVLKLISEYYMLGFFVYDPDTETVYNIFENSHDYSVTTIRNMKAKTGKDMDALSFADVMKIMGRM